MNIRSLVNRVMATFGGLVEEHVSPRLFSHVAAPEGAAHLAVALERYGNLSANARRAVSANSHTLFLQYTRRRWVAYVFRRAEEVLEEKRRS